MSIHDLATHPANFVTVAELAEYWAVSRQQIYKRIESGVLEALCFGARLYRIRTSTALEYERHASVNCADRDPGPRTANLRQGVKSPTRFSLQRVR